MDTEHNFSRAVQPNLVCVLGMHRSGTSAVTQFVHRLGAAVAPQLLAAMEGVNQEGFWEDSVIVDINERLLAARGAHWYGCCDVLAEGDVSVEARLHAEALRHVQENYALSKLSAVKDPRLCRLLPFWLDVWAAAGVSPFFLHVVRHPFAVAKSLYRRDKIPHEYGIALWLLHTLEGVRSANTYPGVLVVYDMFMQNPRNLADALFSRYGAAFGSTQSGRLEAACEIIRGDLRHNDQCLDIQLGLSELCNFAVSLYEAICLANCDDIKALESGKWYEELQQILHRHDADMAMLSRLCMEMMHLSAESVRIGELHSVALATLKRKDEVIADRDQFIKDLMYLKLWRVVPRILRSRVRKL